MDSYAHYSDFMWQSTYTQSRLIKSAAAGRYFIFYFFIGDLLDEVKIRRQFAYKGPKT